MARRVWGPAALVRAGRSSIIKMERNLKNQTKVYEKASDARRSIKVIVYFNKAQKKRAEAILKKLKLEGREDVVLVDVRQDNKPSGSKA